jgi:phosphoribosyl 1,2-cyclic phosphodiesterase
VRVTFCGVRGSTPSPGTRFARHGGHTSCVAVAAGDGPPTLLLDAGTGIREVHRLLRGAPFRGSVLLTHLHWDHWQGLPFFSPGFAPGARVAVSAPEQDGPAERALTGMMRPPYFPVAFDGLGAGWELAWRTPGTDDVEGFRVTAREIPHKGGRTFGYRVESAGGGVLAYVTDHGPSAYGPGERGDGPLHDAALELAAGADLLLHDAQHVAEEFPALAFLGHSTAEYAVRLGEAAGARRVVLFHHDPSRTDAELDAITARFRDRAVPVEAAREGTVHLLP